jgi:hypothetical protein
MLPKAKARHSAIMKTATVQIARSEALQLPATGFMPTLRGKSRSGAPPALAEMEPRFKDEVKSVASLATPQLESEGFFQENWLFVFALAMFVVLTSFAAILALT